MFMQTIFSLVHPACHIMKDSDSLCIRSLARVFTSHVNEALDIDKVSGQSFDIYR